MGRREGEAGHFAYKQFCLQTIKDTQNLTATDKN